MSPQLVSAHFLVACRSRSNLRRALITSVVVGPLLSAINQTALVWRLLHGELLPPVAVLRVSLTFLVPFTVSLVSAALADARRLPARCITDAVRPGQPEDESAIVMDGGRSLHS